MPFCSGRITAFLGNIVSLFLEQRQLRYNGVFYGPGFFPTGRRVDRTGADSPSCSREAILESYRTACPLPEDEERIPHEEGALSNIDCDW